MAEWVRDARHHPYFQVQNVVIDRYVVAIGAIGLAVYVALCRRAGRDVVCWPELGDLCRLAGVGKTAARDAIIRLELVGLVEVGQRVDEGGQRGNVYTLLEPSPEGPPAEWAAGFPRDARLYRRAARPERPVVELPEPLRVKSVRNVPPPHRVAVAPPPCGGGSPTVSRRGSHRVAAGLPFLEENTVKKEDRPELDGESVKRLRMALENIRSRVVVPEHLRLSGAEMERLAARPEWRREVERYRKGIGG